MCLEKIKEFFTKDSMKEENDEWFEDSFDRTEEHDDGRL